MLVREFMAKNKNHSHASTIVFTELGTLYFFFFSKLKTPMKGKRFAAIEGEKRKIETGAVGDTKKYVSKKCSKNWKNRWYKGNIFEGSYFAGDKIVVDK